MAIFEVEGPDGKVYEVDAPSAEKAAAAIRQMGQPEKGFGQVVYENVFGDDDPTTQNTGEKIGSFLNKAGESLTLGLIGDESSAAAESLMLGVPYDDRLQHYRDQENVLERDNPGMALTADIGGAIGGALLPLGAIGTLGRGARLVPRVAASMGAGAGMGATYGFMEGEGADDRMGKGVSGGTIGGVVGALAPAVGSLVRRGADALTQRSAMRAAGEAAETAANQRAASGQSYSAFENSGAEISPAALTRLRMSVVDALQPKYPLPGKSRTPGGDGLIATLTKMDDEVQAAARAGKNPAIPLGAIEELRRNAGIVAQDVNSVGRATADARMGTVAIKEIDDFVNGLQAADVPIGDVATAKAALAKARDLWARASKTQLLDNVLDAQDNYLGGSASAIRNKTAWLLRNPRTARAFSDAEKAMLRKIIGGNGLTRAVRLLGNGLGRQAQMLGGAGLGGVPGALAGMLTGEVTGAIADRNAVRAAETVRNIIANGGMQTMPVATDVSRRLVEALARRSAASIPQ